MIETHEGAPEVNENIELEAFGNRVIPHIEDEGGGAGSGVALLAYVIVVFGLLALAFRPLGGA